MEQGTLLLEIPSWQVSHGKPAPTHQHLFICFVHILWPIHSSAGAEEESICS